MGRLLARVALFALALALPASASAATRMYVSTSRAADGTASASGYAFDGTTQIVDDFQLDLVRGGATVATASAPGFVLLAPAALEPGDALVLTDTTTAATRTATFTGEPTLSAPSCGGAAFSGTREDGSTVDLSAAVGSDSVPTVTLFGAGTTYAGAFARALSTGWVVQASQARAIDAGFTVFDAVSAVVGGACPAVLTATVPAAPAPVVEPAAPAPAPAAPAAVPVAVADTLAPLGRTSLRTAVASAYKALIAGTFTAAVTVSEPGTVTQRLLAGKAVLATASRTTAKAGTVTLKLKLSKAGRRRLSTAKATTLTLTTRVRDAAGNARTLPARRFTAKRAAR